MGTVLTTEGMAAGKQEDPEKKQLAETLSYEAFKSSSELEVKQILFGRFRQAFFLLF